MNNSNTSFSILTINLRFGRADDGPNSWENRKSRYSTFFHKYRPDFICTQEANDFQADFIKKLLPEYTAIGQRIPAPAYWQDNIIFYKNTWRCLSQDRLFLSHTPTQPSRLPGSKWPRQYVVGHFKKNEKALICINTHFDFDASVQKKSAGILLSDSILNGLSDIPAIITGDFNSEPDSPCHRKFVSEKNSKENFRDIFEGNHSCTYHGFTGKCTGGHIDWILFRGPLELIGKKIIRDKFDDGYPSDHFPVLADFQWSGM